MSDLKQQIATIVENAIQSAIRIYESPQGIGDHEVIGLTLDAAEELAKQFDIFPKGELQKETRERELLSNGGMLRTGLTVHEDRFVSGWNRADQS